MRVGVAGCNTIPAHQVELEHGARVLGPSLAGPACFCWPLKRDHPKSRKISGIKARVCDTTQHEALEPREPHGPASLQARPSHPFPVGPTCLPSKRQRLQLPLSHAVCTSPKGAHTPPSQHSAAPWPRPSKAVGGSVHWPDGAEHAVAHPSHHLQNPPPSPAHPFPEKRRGIYFVCKKLFVISVSN